MDLQSFSSEFPEGQKTVSGSSQLDVVREESLLSRVEAPGFLQLTAWRGRARGRHVFIIRRADDHELADESSGVALAVERRPDGTSLRIDVAVIEEIGLFFLWVTAMRVRGANEIHLHRSVAPAENLEVAHSLAVGAFEQTAPALPAAA